MTIYSTDFSEYTLDTNLSDWTVQWGDSADISYKARSNSNPYRVSEKKLEFVDTGSDGRKVVTWDDVGSVADIDILAKIKMGSVIGTSAVRIYARVSGSDTTENCYFVQVLSTSFGIHKYVAGTSLSVDFVDFNLSANDEFWVRFSLVGTALKAKIWEKDSVEPDDWTIEVTDSSLSSGLVGLGHYESTLTFYCDYFECVTVSGSATYPPSGWDYNNAFSTINGTDAVPPYLNTGKAQGGQFIDSSRKLKGVSIYCVDHSDDIRIAVYSGGSLVDGPEGATLLKDFGLTSGSVTNDYVTITTGDDIDIPVDTPIWFVIKGDNAAGFSFRASTIDKEGCHGNFQLAKGRFDVTDNTGNDPDVAFAGTFPTGTETDAAYWYDVKILLDGDLDGNLSTTQIHQLTAEVLADGEPNARIHQVTTEVLASGVSEVALHQAVVEVIEAGSPEVALHQMVVEVIEQYIPAEEVDIPPVFMII